MADDKGSEAKVEPAAADPEAAVITDLDWDVQLTKVQRVEPDAESDDLDDLFTVTFAVDGPNANASVEVMARTRLTSRSWPWRSTRCMARSWLGPT